MKKVHVCMVAMAVLTVVLILTGSQIDWVAASAPEAGLLRTQLFHTKRTESVLLADTGAQSGEAAGLAALDLSQDEAAGETEEERIPFGDLMFLGDSMLANPERISQSFTAHGHQILAGNGATVIQFFGVSTHNVTVGVENLGTMTGTLAGRSFPGIVILLGANDISFLTAAQAFDNYRALMEELAEAYDVPIFALKVYPVNERYAANYGESADSRNARSGDLNRLLAEYCAETDGAYFIDATGPFTSEEGYLLHDVGDGLHIHSDTYERFYQEIEEALRGSGVFEET